MNNDPTEVVLHHHVAAVEVDVDPAGIDRTAGVHELVFLDQDPVAGPRPETAAAAVHAGIGTRAGASDDVAAHQQVIDVARLDRRATDLDHVVFKDLRLVDGISPPILRPQPTPETGPMKREAPVVSLRFSGRVFSQQELAVIRAWLAENTLCREDLARRVCQEFGWLNAAGKPRHEQASSK